LQAIAFCIPGFSSTRLFPASIWLNACPLSPLSLLGLVVLDEDWGAAASISFRDFQIGPLPQARRDRDCISDRFFSRFPFFFCFGFPSLSPQCAVFFSLSPEDAGLSALLFPRQCRGHLNRTWIPFSSIPCVERAFYPSSLHFAPKNLLGLAPSLFP